ncbi:MAG: DUF169 domain-containing protein [Deltaproteobacteria bacterium]|nr:DUF169 domain-containing protein [Deltaproteobacteria bacterium]
MQSAIVQALRPQVSPVALRFADSAPANAFSIPEGKWGCVMWLLASAAKGRPAAASRATFGCLGGGTGLGFGNQYLNWPGGIECFHYFLSTGNEQWEHGRAAEAEARSQLRARALEHFVHGERYLASPELVRRFVDRLPMTDVPTRYVVLEPLDQVAAGDRPEVVVFLVDADRLAALAILAGFARQDNDAVVMPQAAGCQSIGIFAYAENRSEHPRAVVGPTDISARLYLNRQLGRRDLMTFAVAFRLYQEMEANVEKSLLAGERWQEVLAAGR